MSAPLIKETAMNEIHRVSKSGSTKALTALVIVCCLWCLREGFAPSREAAAGVDSIPKNQIGVCDMAGLVNDVLSKGTYGARLNEKRVEWTALVAPFQAEVDRLVAKINAESDDNNAMIGERVSLLNAQRMVDNQRVNVHWEEDHFLAKNVVETYNQIRLVAAATAREAGIQLLIQSSPNGPADDVVLVHSDIAWFVQDLSSRVLLVPDGATDITEQVRAKLIASGVMTDAAKPSEPAKPGK
jgi:hypothetical protein